MNREVQVRFREEVGVKFPCLTRFGGQLFSTTGAGLPTCAVLLLILAELILI
jgi:hypothetical protein